MAPLSNMLGNIYGDDDDPKESSSGAATDDGTEAAAEEGPPEWADDDRLDDAFADWRAGEMPDDVDEDATAVLSTETETEPSVRSIGVGELDVGRAARPHSVQDGFRDLGADDAIHDVPDRVEPNVVAEHVTDTAPSPPHWRRGDDDLLPSKPSRGRRGLRRP